MAHTASDFSNCQKTLPWTLIKPFCRLQISQSYDSKRFAIGQLELTNSDSIIVCTNFCIFINELGQLLAPLTDFRLPLYILMVDLDLDRETHHANMPVRTVSVSLAKPLVAKRYNVIILSSSSSSSSLGSKITRLQGHNNQIVAMKSSQRSSVL